MQAPPIHSELVRTSRLFSRILLAYITLAIGPIATGCSNQEPSQRPDVILLIVDTLRADRVGAYGHARAATIHIDALANSLDAELSDQEWASRRAVWTPPALKATRGTLHRYIKNVKTASEGCVTDE